MASTPRASCRALPPQAAAATDGSTKARAAGAGQHDRLRSRRSFALITIPFRGFQHLLRVEEQLGCLNAVHRHLAPGGRLIFDVFHPNPRYLHDPEYLEEKEEFEETPLPDGRRFRRTWRIAAYRRAEQINEIEFIYYLTNADGSKERIVELFPLRYFFRYELEHLLARAGFRVANLYGNLDRSPLADDSPEIIFVAEKQV
jgi:SAM-dependent methyltransferase